MKISIITVVLNAQATVRDTLTSIHSQTYSNWQHIVIDGGSSDGTLQILDEYKADIDVLVSQVDDGLYHAMNKGLALTTGDVIGFLNADDVFANSTVLEQIAGVHADTGLDACYADLHYVDQSDISNVVRRWKSRDHVKNLCYRGWMPAHPTLYMKRRVYDQVGDFNISLKYQSDLEFCTRVFEIEKVTSLYIPKLWVNMRLGGVTNNSWRTILLGNWESYLALRKLGLKRDPLSYFLIKFSSRIKQYF